MAEEEAENNSAMEDADKRMEEFREYVKDVGKDKEEGEENE